MPTAGHPEVVAQALVTALQRCGSLKANLHQIRLSFQPDHLLVDAIIRPETPQASSAAILRSVQTDMDCFTPTLREELRRMGVETAPTVHLTSPPTGMHDIVFMPPSPSPVSAKPPPSPQLLSPSPLPLAPGSTTPTSLLISAVQTAFKSAQIGAHMRLPQAVSPTIESWNSFSEGFEEGRAMQASAERIGGPVQASQRFIDDISGTAPLYAARIAQSVRDSSDWLHARISECVAWLAQKVHVIAREVMWLPHAVQWLIRWQSSLICAVQRPRVPPETPNGTDVEGRGECDTLLDGHSLAVHAAAVGVLLLALLGLAHLVFSWCRCLSASVTEPYDDEVQYDRLDEGKQSGETEAAQHSMASPFDSGPVASHLFSPLYSPAASARLFSSRLPRQTRQKEVVNDLVSRMARKEFEAMERVRASERRRLQDIEREEKVRALARERELREKPGSTRQERQMARARLQHIMPQRRSPRHGLLYC